MPDYILNQVTARHQPFPGFLDIAAAAGCVGVEARDDLGRPLFDGDAPEAAARLAEERGLTIVGLNQIWPFDVPGRSTLEAVRALASTARDCGARFVSLIPRIDRPPGDPEQDSPDYLARVLEPLLPALEAAGVVGLVEALGFPGATVRGSAVVVEAIERIGAQGRIQLVHDTFQHTFAGGWPLAPARTGLVQVSDALRPPPFDADLDGHRVLPGGADHVGNAAQLRALVAGGYDGPVSFECTAPEMHGPRAIQKSISWLSDRLAAQDEPRPAEG